MNATLIAPHVPLQAAYQTPESTHDARQAAHEAEVDKEIASAGRALFLAAFTVVVGSLTAAILISILHFRF